MTTFTISLAGVPARIDAIYPATERFCADYRTEEAPAISVVLTAEDIAGERVMSAREDELEGIPTRHFPDAYLETLALYRKLASELIEHDAVVFHGSVLAWEGKAYIFTAKSGTGKTTHTRLWLETVPDAHVLNGDKPLLRLDGERVLACGTPWRGKENYGCREILPLAAICILERDTQNHIEPVTFHEALPILIQQTHRPDEPDALMKTLKLVGDIGTRVRLYRLGCNMEREAALVSWRGMTGAEGAWA